ncbi:MAG: hypothetical protein H0T90_02505 [Gemmatimonadales bacterium]|nr:hypothetical protein [Gemmatimonadales bacterium]
MTKLQSTVRRRQSLPILAVEPEARTLLRLKGRAFSLTLAGAIALGVLVRVYHVLSQDFPLNDGGLFYAMARDLQAAGFRLPAFTSYNQASIPYGYSPLGFYLAGWLDAATPLSLLETFRWLPLVVTCLTVAAFAGLARALLAQRAAVVAAVLAFALLPRSFIWMLMGGGLTRSLGFLFALVTLLQLYRLYTRQDWRLVPGVAVGAALTALSHLGTAPFLTFSSVLLLLAYGRHRHALVSSLVAALGALGLSAPWWGQVLAVHGPGPFLAAGATGGSIFSGLTLWETVHTLAISGLGTGESVLGLIGMLGALGFFYSLSRGEWLLPAWWIAIVVLDARQGSTFATVPIALLAGVTVVHLLLPAISRATAPATLRRNPGRHAWAPAAVLGLFLVFSTVTAFLRRPEVTGGLPDLTSLSPAERAAMRWVANETPRSARMLVVSGTPWEIDRSSEWLPVLGERVSVATVQGYEWRPVGQFVSKKRQYNDLQGCARWISACLADWSRSTGVGYTHVYIPRSANRECCHLLLYSLARDPEYQRVYDQAGAVVFVRREPPLAATP